jgi:biopolymer transport protein ExbD
MDILDDANLRGGDYQPASALLSMEDDFGEFIPPSQLRRSGRRRWREPVLNITSFVDVLSVLLFFLLSVATLEKLGSHDVNLLQQSQAFAPTSTVELKNLSLSLSPDKLKLRGMVTAEGKEPEVLDLDLPLAEGGRYDVEKLQAELLRLKSTYKTDEAIILMVGDTISFDAIVKVMDGVRERVEYANGARRITALFPSVSLSDYLVDNQA